MLVAGIFQAFAITLLITFYNVIIRIAVQQYDIQPVVFTCVCLMTSAFILSLASGPGRLVRETLKSKATWAYSLILIGTYIADIYVVRLVSATEASFLSRLTIPLSLIVALIFLKRKPKKSDLLGTSLVIIGLGALLYIQPSDILPPLLFVALLSATFQTFQFFIAETHSEAVAANKNGTIRDKARVVGFVTFVSSCVFLILALGLSLLNETFNISAIHSLNFIAKPEDFIHPATVWTALFYGVIFLPFMRYFKWAASYNIKSENLIMFLAFVPLTTLGLEALVSLHPSLDLTRDLLTGDKGKILLSIAILMTLGAGLTAFLRLRKELLTSHSGSILKALKKSMLPEDKTLTIQHASHGMDDYETVLTTIEYCNDDIEKASAILGVPTTSIEVILTGKGRHAFVNQVSRDVSRRFRQNIALSDALTKLENRTAFMATLKESTTLKEAFSVLYMDLDKFKPVNDTYGHEAGDVILKTVADRLIDVLPKSASIARLGGDEFAALIKTDKSKIQSYVDKIDNALNKPFKIQSTNKPVLIGVSIGVAHYPDDAITAKDLLNRADGSMYGEKKNRE